jgi:hypothetical protein
MVSLSFGTANIDTKNKSAKLFGKILHFLIFLPLISGVIRVFHLVGLLIDTHSGHHVQIGLIVRLRKGLGP